MKKFYLLAILLPMLAIAANAQPFTERSDETVGIQPAGVVFNQRQLKFHIFCAGYDANFNGVKDSGDVAPSWWTMHLYLIAGINEVSQGEIEKVRDFEFGSWDFFAPFNPGVYNDVVDKKSVIYLSQFGRIRCYDMDTYQVVDDTVVKSNATAIWASKDSLIYSVRNGNSGKVFILDLASKKLIDSVDAAMNVQKIMKFNGGLAILNEGSFGQNDSKLIIAKKIGNTWLSDTITLGNGANDFDIFKGNIAVTMNGSHKVLIVSVQNNSIKKTIDVGTTGYDGPRTVRFYGKESGQSNVIAVSTYTGDVRFFETNTGNLLFTLATKGKAEGFDFMGQGCIVIANQFLLGKYIPDSTITIWTVPNSVDEMSFYKDVKVYPNPSSDNVNIDISNLKNNVSTLRIIDNNGNTIMNFGTDEINSGKLSISAKKLNLNSGQYFVQLISGNMKIGIPFLIVK